MLSMGIPFIGGWLFLALTKPLNLDEAYFFYIGRFVAGTRNIYDTSREILRFITFLSQALVEVPSPWQRPFTYPKSQSQQ